MRLNDMKQLPATTHPAWEYYHRKHCNPISQLDQDHATNPVELESVLQNPTGTISSASDCWRC